jgi:shikimate kinase
MGSGKSTVASLLGSMYRKLQVIDLDSEILRTHDYKNISQLFAERGNEYFRQQEKQVAERFNTLSSVVLSPGAGVVEYPETMKALLTPGTYSIYLYASFNSICQRVTDIANRPLFKNADAALELYNRRLPLYNKYCTVAIDTTNLSPSAVAEIISAMITPTTIIKRSN